MSVIQQIQKLILLLFIPCLTIAQKDAVSFGVGTNGIGLNYQHQITPRLSAGLGASFIYLNANFQFQALNEIITNDVRTQSAQLEANLSWYVRLRKKSHPKASKQPFFIKAGIAARIDPSYYAETTLRNKPAIGSFQLTEEDVGYIYSSVLTQLLQPMLSIGFKPINKEQFFLQLETGAYYHGRPQLKMDATGLLNANDVNQESVQKVLNKYQLFPLIRLEAGFKF